MGKHRIYPYHSENTGSYNYNNRRNNTLSKSTGSRNGTVHKCRKSITKSHNRKSFHSGIHNRRIIGKKTQELSAEDNQCNTTYSSNSKGISQADQITVSHSFSFPCTVILPHKASAGCIKSSHGVIQKSICICRSGITCHHCSIKGIDACLDKQICHLKNTVLQSCRKTDLDKVSCHSLVNPQFGKTKCIIPAHFYQRPKDQKRR